jgi:hypothetical protein
MPKAEFGRNARTADGLNRRCKECDRVESARFRAANPSYYADWQSRNRERKNARRRVWEFQHRQDRTAYERERCVAIPSYRIAKRLRTRLNAVLAGRAKTGSAVRDLGCVISELKAWLESQFQPGMTWENWSPTGWHIDHKKPLASFDLTDPEQFRQAVHYTNLQPLWAEDNLAKGAR